MRRTALVLLALFSSCLSAEWVNEQGDSVTDSDDRKAVGDFGAQLVFVADEQALFKQWATPSATIDLNTVESVTVDQPINAFVIFSGCKATPKGVCDVSMTLRVIQPDGKISYETPALEVWQDKPAPPTGVLQLSARFLKFVAEPQDQRGRYIIQAQVRDDNSGAVISLEKAFGVTDAKSSDRRSFVVQGALRDQSAQRP
jgi:hypothetical protein